MESGVFAEGLLGLFLVNKKILLFNKNVKFYSDSLHMLSDTFNNNLSQSVTNTSTPSGRKLAMLSCSTPGCSAVAQYWTNLKKKKLPSVT